MQDNAIAKQAAISTERSRFAHKASARGAPVTISASFWSFFWPIHKQCAILIHTSIHRKTNVPESVNWHTSDAGVLSKIASMPILMWKHNVERFTKVLACAITKEGVWGSKAVVRLSISQADHLNTVACQGQIFSHFIYSIYFISVLPGYEWFTFKPCQNQSAKRTAYTCLITMRADSCKIFLRDHAFIFDETASDSQASHKYRTVTMEPSLNPRAHWPQDASQRTHLLDGIWAQGYWSASSLEPASKCPIWTKLHGEHSWTQDGA